MSTNYANYCWVSYIARNIVLLSSPFSSGHAVGKLHLKNMETEMQRKINFRKQNKWKNRIKHLPYIWRCIESRMNNIQCKSALNNWLHALLNYSMACRRLCIAIAQTIIILAILPIDSSVSCSYKFSSRSMVAIIFMKYYNVHTFKISIKWTRTNNNYFPAPVKHL